jgi:hypothetical protein
MFKIINIYCGKYWRGLYMNLINNKLFIELDNFLDLSTLDKFEEEICLGFAKSEKYISLGSTPTQSILNSNNHLALQDVKKQARLKHPTLSDRELEWYSLLMGGEAHGYILFLKNIKRYPQDFRFKSLSDHCTYMPPADHFRFLFKWIDDQKCFKEYGRVLFFVSHPGQTGMIHRDNAGIEFLKDQYLWITGPKFPKSIFLYDETTGEKTYAKSRSTVFDNRNYHGTENPHECATWSLRIDGVFSEDFLEKTSIKDYFSS